MQTSLSVQLQEIENHMDNCRNTSYVVTRTVLVTENISDSCNGCNTAVRCSGPRRT